MIEELAALPQAQAVPLDIADVDQNALFRARYGHKVPVLLLNGELVCHGRLDSEELHKALAALR